MLKNQTPARRRAGNCVNALWDADAPLTAAELETALPGPPRARTTLLNPAGPAGGKGCVPVKRGEGLPLHRRPGPGRVPARRKPQPVGPPLRRQPLQLRSRPCRNRHPHRRRHRRADGILGGTEKRENSVKFVEGRALSAPTCNSPSTCSIIICPIVSTFASEVTPMPGDLHTHTTFSDGSTPADKLPFLAAARG